MFSMFDEMDDYDAMTEEEFQEELEVAVREMVDEELGWRSRSAEGIAWEFCEANSHIQRITSSDVLRIVNKILDEKEDA